MFYLGSDAHSRRVIEEAHRERAAVFATLWARLFGRRTGDMPNRRRSATV